MTASRRKMAARRRRRWPLIVLGVVAVIVVVIALTEPRQLPGIIADQPAVRVVYSWKEGMALWVHRQMYPLSTLRDDAAATPKTGTGYDSTARDALDELIEEKTETDIKE